MRGPGLCDVSRRRNSCRRLLALPAGLLLLAGAIPRRAEAVEAIRLGPLQLMLGGEASGSFAAVDDGHFNESEYGLSLLRLLRIGVCGELRAGPHFAVLGEMRSENLDRPRLYALYVRTRPWRDRGFDLQAGLVPPVFGTFARRYGGDPALIGYPLAYHYPTLVRADAAPRGVEDLLRWRGSGWWLRYPTGAADFDHGLPLVTALRWDTGVQARLVAEAWQLSAAVTQGTLGNPLVRDDNGSKQVSARVAWRSSFGLEAGASLAQGGYASRELLASIPAAQGRDFRQRALGLDAEHAWGHWVLRGEAIWSDWDAVAATPPLLGERLRATALSVEGRYRPWAGVTLAARLDHLGFGEVLGATEPLSWDAPVSRFEAGVGYALRRNLSFKLSYQRNWRNDGRSPRRDFVAVQGAAWF